MKENDLGQLQDALKQVELSSHRSEEKENDESAVESLKAELFSSQETVNILGCVCHVSACSKCFLIGQLIS